MVDFCDQRSSSLHRTNMSTSTSSSSSIQRPYYYAVQHYPNSDDVPAVQDLFSSADDDFFHQVKSNSKHVLQPYLPDKIDIPYQLCTRSHNMTLINKTKFLNADDYLIRMLYKYSY